MNFKNLDESINSYLKAKVKNKSEDGTYSPKITAFKNYLLDFKEIDLRNDFITDLKSISYLDIKESMKYYVRTSKDKIKKVNSKETIKIYLEVIKEFFRFAHNNGISNKSLLAQFEIWDTNSKSFEQLIEEVTKEEQLRDKLVMEPLSKKEFDYLIHLCNKNIKQFSKDDIFTGKKNTKYKFFLSALIIKLILETGIKYRVIGGINHCDLDINLGTITIHSKYKLKLSEELISQFQKYQEIRDEFIKKNINSVDVTKLFFHTNDIASPTKNNYVTEFIKKIGRTDTTGISKIRIIQLLQEGVPQVLIRDLTTYNSDVIDDCVNRIKQSGEYIEDYTEINKYFNKNLIYGSFEKQEN